MTNAANYLLMRDAIAVANAIVKWLGTPGLVGMALMEAHYEGMPWRSARQLGLRANCSEDTARRRAEELVACNRAAARREQGRNLYSIDPKVADAVLASIRSLDENAGLTATCGEPFTASPPT